MNMQKLLRQAQEMQEKMQRELGEAVVEASVGGGMVTVTINGHKQLTSLKIEREAIDPEDTSLLEDLIVAAVNEAGRKMDESLRQRVGSMAASLPNVF